MGCVVVGGVSSCSTSFPSVHCIGSTIQETVSGNDMQAQQTDDQFLTLFGIRHGCLAMSLYFYFWFIIIWIIVIIIQNCIHSIHNIMQSTTRTRDKALQFDVYLNNKARNSCIWIAVETNFQCIILAVISCYLSSSEKFLRTSDFNGNGTLTSAVPMWIGVFSPTQMVECYIGITEVKVLVPFRPEFSGLPR